MDHRALSRRKALALSAGGAITIAAANSRRAAAAEPSAPARSPSDASAHGSGFYRTTVGQLTIDIVSDGWFPFNPPHPTFGSNRTADEVNAALRDRFIEPDAAFGQVNALLVRSATAVVLVDTGCGTLFGPTTGHLVRHLQRLGVTPADVTHVVLTHAHPDHFGGLLTDGAPTFTNAAHLIAKPELEFWLGDADLSRSTLDDRSRGDMTSGARGTLRALGSRWTALDVAADRKAPIAEGIEAVAAFGHTPGHIAIELSSERQNLLWITDAIHHSAIQMAHPDWHVRFDTDPVQAASTRSSLLARAADQRLRITGAHLPFPALGHVRRAGGAFDFVPEPWRWA